MAKRKKIACQVLLILATVLGYHHVLNSPFIFDDFINIVDNPYNQIKDLSTGELNKVFSRFQPSASRPAANLSFALNYLAGGFDPTGFHLVNIIIHAITALVVFRLFIWYFTQTGSSENTSLFYACLAALLWATNPVQTNAVTYIVQRMTSLCSLFASASLLCYLTARTLSSHPQRNTQNMSKTILFTTAFLCWILAMLTKEIAAVMPVIIIIHEIYFFDSVSSLRKKTRRYRFYLGIALLICLLNIIYWGPQFWDTIIRPGYALRDFSLTERLLTETRVIMKYISLFLFPIPARLQLYYDYPLSRSLFTPMTTLYSLFGLMLILAGVYFGFKRYKLISFGLLWTFSCLIIESSVIPLELIFEHRFYLPSIGFSLAIIAAIVELARTCPQSQKPLSALLAVIIGLQISLTYQRNLDWQTELSFINDALKKTPQYIRVHIGLAEAYQRAGDMESAKKTLLNALTLEPTNLSILADLVMVYFAVNEHQTGELFLSKLKKSIPGNPFTCIHSSRLNKLSEKLFLAKKYQDVPPVLEPLKQCTGQAASPVIFDNLGIVYAKLGNTRKAIENYTEALERDPRNSYYRYSLAKSYFLNNSKEKAIIILKDLQSTKIPVDLLPKIKSLESLVNESERP